MSQYAEKILNKIAKYINQAYAGWKSIHQRFFAFWVIKPKLSIVLDDPQANSFQNYLFLGEDAQFKPVKYHSFVFYCINLIEIREKF